MKLTDYVANFLADNGIGHVFGLTGGAAVHLFDSVAKNPNLEPVFCHHEQAACLAAKAYAHVKNDFGSAIVTTGPGGTNAVTGVCAAWLDSIPCIYISGQSRLEHTSHGKSIRQLGTQELDIVSLVSHITKYAVMITDPKMIKYHLQKAAFIAKSGRPGPVWIDIPLNFQWSDIDPDKLPSFDHQAEKAGNSGKEDLKGSVQLCLDSLSSAQRPLVLAGYGIRLSHATDEFRQFIEALRLPFVSSWNASDMLPTDHSLYAGRPGIAGQRGANFAMQNCDVLLVLGSHLSIPLTGTMYGAFARDAKILMVDIDPVELEFKTVRVDCSVQADVKDYLQNILGEMGNHRFQDINKWRDRCLRYKSYNAVPKSWKKQKEHVNPYVFIDMLSDELGNGDAIVIDGGGTVVYQSFQAFKVKSDQRLIISSGICAMGTGLPESIGACIANYGRRTICLCGDGSMQLNIQELQTIVHHKLPIKIFIFNNGGYLAIRHTQDGFLDSNYVGSSEAGGLSLPDFLKVAKAYGIKAQRAKNHKDLKRKVRWALEEPGPAICEIMIARDQEIVPRQGFKQMPDGTYRPLPLEDMHPLLDRKEFMDNMVIEPWRE